MLGNGILPNNPPQKIASITKERQFSAAIMDEDTQLVFDDEWSHPTLESDMAKFYITTNVVPDFGDEDENVKRPSQSSIQQRCL